MSPLEEKPRRTLVFLIEQECDSDEPLAHHTIRTLREYADELESKRCGNDDVERWVDSEGAIVKVVHGVDGFLG